VSQADGEDAGEEGAAAAGEAEGTRGLEARPPLGAAKDSASSLDARPLLKGAGSADEQLQQQQQQQRADPGAGAGRAGSSRSASGQLPESASAASLASSGLPPPRAVRGFILSCGIGLRSSRCCRHALSTAALLRQGRY
jgi:hypothetical protein